MFQSFRTLVRKVKPRSVPPVTWLRYFIYLLPFIFFGLIINHHVFLTPELRYSYFPGRLPNVIHPAVSTDLVRTADVQMPWRITSDAYKFSVRIPRIIDALRVRLRLFPGTQPFTALTAIGLGGQSLKTIIQSTFLDRLSWSHVSESPFTLWSRPSTEKHSVRSAPSLEWLRNENISGSNIGVFGIDPMYFTEDAVDQKPIPGDYLLATSLRGNHTLYSRVTAADPRLVLSFTKSDLNRISGSDAMTIFVGQVADLQLDKKNWASITRLKDDGDVGSKGVPGADQRVQLELPNVIPGLYRIEIEVGDDALLSNIRTNQQATNFYGQVNFAQGANYHLPINEQVRVTANGTKFIFRTKHLEGKQRLKFGLDTLTVSGTNLDFPATAKNNTTNLVIPQPDIQITSNGLFAPVGTILLPAPAQEVSFALNPPNIDGIDYLVVQYLPLTKEVSSFEREYKLSELGLSTNDVFFQIDAPELRVNNSILGLKEINVTLIRGPFPWRQILNKIQKVF